MRILRLIGLAAALACASAARADDTCAREKARTLLAARLRDWFSDTNRAWLRDPQRYAALALASSEAAPACREGLVIEVRAPSHGSCVKFLMKVDRSGEPRLSILEERSCSRRARDERMVSVVVDERDLRPNDLPASD